MNWLAHLVLAGDEPIARVGQLAGDFVRGREIDTLIPELRAAVLAHRALDAFADAHPAMRAARARVVGPLRRWAPVLCDVFFDHLLARDFESLGPGSGLDGFVDLVHAELLEHLPLLPARLRALLPRLTAERWLTSYADLDGIHLTLRRMEHRLRRPVALADGVAQLRDQDAGFARDFDQLWAALRARASSPGFA